MNHFSIRRLTTWIGEQMTAHTLAVTKEITEDPGPTVRIGVFALYHIGSGETEVKTISITGRAWDPTQLAKLFYGAATSYASEIASGSGMQQFMLYAIPEGKQEPSAQHPLRCGAEQDTNNLSTEPATQQGHMAQMMRHNEAIIQMGFNALGRMNERLMHTFDESMKKQAEAIELVAEVIHRAAEDEHQKRIDVMKLEDRRKVMGMAPGLINMLAGKEIFPGTAIDSDLIKQIAEEYSGEELQALLMRLKPHHQAILADRMQKAVEEKQARDAMVKNGTGVS